MKFTALWPLIELFAFGMVFKCLRWADRSFSSDKYTTAQPSMQTYIELHAGPVFAISYRYSSVLLLLSVSLFYGTGLPQLYQIALVGFII
jgi:hypothetical protein